MAVKEQWKDLSPRVRRLILIGATVEGGLKVAALVDMKRRPAEQIRGKKRTWALAMLLNSGGLIPLSYFAIGRRR